MRIMLQPYIIAQRYERPWYFVNIITAEGVALNDAVQIIVQIFVRLVISLCVVIVPEH